MREVLFTGSRKRKRMRWALILACLALIGVAGAWNTLSGVAATRPPLDVGEATVPALPPHVHALGRLEPRGTVLRIAGPTSVDGSRVEVLHVAEGDQVSEGSTLAVLDTAARRRAALSEATARVEAARARLAQIQAGAKPSEVAAQSAAVARCEADLRDALLDHRRIEALARRTVATPESVEDTRHRVDSARLDLERARATLAGLTDIRDVDVDLQECEIRASEAAAERARAELDATHLRAPVNGRVLKIHARAGERISDLGLLEMGSTDTMHAVAEVYEADLPRVRIGQSARVRLMSSGTALAGTVESIGLLVGRKDVLNNDPVSDTDARVVEVRIRLHPSDGRTVEGFSNARVDVMISVE